MAATLFISDCHLDHSRPRLIDVFVRFMRERAARADALYILGDLFDYWVGDDMPKESLAPVLKCLRETSARIPIYFMHGNRDFLIGKRFAHDSGCRLLGATQVIDLQGRRTLLMHGDLLCSDDRAYQRYRKIIQNPLSRQLLARLPLAVRLSVAQRLRRISTRAVAVKKPDIMDVNNDTVSDYMRRFKVDQLIHGHTHRPGIHTISSCGQGSGQGNEPSRRRIVLGDWYEQGSVLTVARGEPRLEVLR